MTPKEEVALRKRIEALEAAQPKPTPRMPTAEEIAEHNDRMHQMREGRMNAATPPSALQAMVEAEPNGFMSGVMRDNRAPTGRPGMIPTQPSASGAAPVNKSGWVDAAPISPPPNLRYVDAQLIADEVRQRAELKRKLGE